MAISDVCARQGQRRVLIEGTIARRERGTMDSFGLGSLVGSMLTGVSLVAQNRGVRVEFFDSREAALRWLG